MDFSNVPSVTNYTVVRVRGKFNFKNGLDSKASFAPNKALFSISYLYLYLFFWHFGIDKFGGNLCKKKNYIICITT